MKDYVCALTLHIDCIQYETVPVPVPVPNLNSNTKPLVTNEFHQLNNSVSHKMIEVYMVICKPVFFTLRLHKLTVPQYCDKQTAELTLMLLEQQRSQLVLCLD